MPRAGIVGLVLTLLFAGPTVELTAQPAWAQDEDRRSGFVIGFSLGPGMSRISSGGFSESKTGVSTDLRIGGQISPTVRLYYLNKVVFSGGTFGGIDFAELVATGVNGVGLSYQASPQFHVSGGVGLGVWTEIDSDGNAESFNSLGLTGGMGFEFADLWVLETSLSYLQPEVLPPESLDIVQFKVSLMVLSH